MAPLGALEELIFVLKDGLEDAGLVWEISDLFFNFHQDMFALYPLLYCVLHTYMKNYKQAALLCIFHREILQFAQIPCGIAFNPNYSGSVFLVPINV